jgi:hypothetical protein
MSRPTVRFDAVPAATNGDWWDIDTRKADTTEQNTEAPSSTQEPTESGLSVYAIQKSWRAPHEWSRPYRLTDGSTAH